MACSDPARQVWDHLLKLSSEEMEARIEQLKKFDPVSSCSHLEQKLSANGCPGAVLRRDALVHFIEEHALVRPFESKHLKPAAYQLSIGSRVSQNGKNRTLGPGDTIVIQPFEVVVIRTREFLRMPHFLIARWNLRVDKTYEGLLWVGGPQVDPGYVGHLFCPIYNLSDKEVVLDYAERFVTIDFILTTPVPQEADGSHFYPEDKRNPTFEFYKPQLLKSALRETIQKKIDQLEQGMKEFETRQLTIAGIGLTLISILFALLAIFLTTNTNFFSGSRADNIWDYVAIGIAIAALVVALARGSRDK